MQHALRMLAVAAFATITTGQSLVIEGGLVFDGSKFESKALYVEDGRFAKDAPSELDFTIDATGYYLIPPFADAHTHRFASSYDAKDSRETFLESGILYVANLCNPKTARTACAPHAGGESGIDVLFANGGLTASGGHPVSLYARLHTDVYRRPADTFWEENEGNTFYVIDSLADLEARWRSILESHPDLIKVLLSHCEEFEQRRDDDRYYGQKGLDPSLLPSVVERAHQARLRVAAHVDTAADYRAAVEAGVDLLAHTPGYGARSESEWDRFALTPADARRAAARGVAQITTAGLARTEAARSVIEHNLKLLLDAGVPLLVGSDQWGDPGGLERTALLDLVFAPEDLLRAWCIETPRALFPDRSVGELSPGFEASLVFLEESPLESPETMNEALLVLKQGRVVLDRRREEDGTR